MNSTKQPTTAAEAARMLKRITDAYQEIDPVSQSAILELLEAIKEYVGTKEEALVYSILEAHYPEPAPTQQHPQEPPADLAGDLSVIADAVRATMPPEAAAQLVLEVGEALEADAAGSGRSFADLPPYDRLCLSCRECYVKGFVDACALAAQANALPDDMKP
jgi:hypothetical protein